MQLELNWIQILKLKSNSIKEKMRLKLLQKILEFASDYDIEKTRIWKK